MPQYRTGGSLSYPALPAIKSAQLVGGAVTQGSAGPYTTNFTLSTAVNPANAIVALASWGNCIGYDFHWALSSGTNLQVTTTGIYVSPAVGLGSSLYFYVIEFFSCKGKVSVSTNVTGNSAANFTVTMTPPGGASPGNTMTCLTCRPLRNNADSLRVTLTLNSLTQANFALQATAQGTNSTKPIQGDIIFF
jgi:hypothetical protein